MAFRRLALGSALALTCSVHLVMHAAGREAFSLDLLLTRPVSPGSITLLGPHAADPRAQARLVEAVSAGDPAVRAAAARVANAARVDAAVLTLRRAIASETFAPAAFEQVRALLRLDEESVPLVLQAVERLQANGDATMARNVVRALGRSRPRVLWQNLPVLARVQETASDWSVLLGIATGRATRDVSVASDAVLRLRVPSAWLGLLLALGNAGSVLPDAETAAALASGLEPIPALTCWHAALHRPPDTVTETIHAAIPPSESPHREGQPMYGCELLRQLREAPEQGRRAVERARKAPEQAGVPEGLRMGLSDTPAPSAEGANHRDPTVTTIRIGGEFPPDVVADVAAAAGCRWPRGVELGGAVLRRDRDGTVRPVGKLDAALSTNCAAAVRALALVNVQVSAEPDAADHELVVLRTDRDGMECLAGSHWWGVPLVGGESGASATLAREAPIVAPTASEMGVRQGRVRVLMGLAASGCVEYAIAEESTNALLALAALKRVSQRRFAISTRDGRPGRGRGQETMDYTFE